MGILDFSKIAYKNVNIVNFEETLTEMDLMKFKDFTIYIDVLFMIHKGIYALKLKGPEDVDTGHLKYMIDELYTLASFDIKLVWMIDPEVMPQMKSETTQKRGVSKVSISYSQKLVEELLLSMGQTIIKCRNLEAEHYAAILCKKDLDKSFVWTADSDVLMYGGNRLYKLGGTYKALRNNDICKAYDISPEQFALACVYLGCDYVDRVPQYGPKSVIARIKGEHKKPLIALDKRHEDAYGHILLQHDDVEEIHGVIDKGRCCEILISQGFTEGGDTILKLHRYFDFTLV